MLRKIFIIFLIIVLSVISIMSILHLFSFDNTNMVWGASFSTEYSRYLGLDPKAVLNTMLDDWGFKNLRLSAQWNDIESQPGVYNFSDTDWQLDAAAARDAKVILAIGQKTPRWPECHVPEWATKLTDDEYQKALKKYISLTVNRYRNHAAIEIWQVENEPFLPFGGDTCRPFQPSWLKDEIALVRTLDPVHQVLVSDSGELSTWRRTAKAGDMFGTTMYRVVWNKYLGYWNYDWIPPIFYRAKLWLNGQSTKQAFVMELQAEPWMPDNTAMGTDIAEQYRSLDLPRLKKNMEFAVRVGWPRTYLWGAEWWYWLATKGHPEFAEFVTKLRKF